MAIVTHEPVQISKSSPEFIDNAFERFKVERQLFIYWLLQAYEAINRAEHEKGKTFSEISENLVDVLGNVGFDPNQDAAAKELLARREVFHTDAAIEVRDEHLKSTKKL
jgi:hypothetical protein